MDVIESDVWTTDGHEVMVTVQDDGNVCLHLIVRDEPGGKSWLFATLVPQAAHELGNKLRLAAKKVGR